MEHRLHKRLVLNIRARLYSGGKLIGLGNVIEISAGGVGVRVDKCDLSADQIVRVDFGVFDASRPAVTAIRAMVVHVTAKSVGLMFAQEVKLASLVSDVRYVADLEQTSYAMNGHKRLRRG